MLNAHQINTLSEPKLLNRIQKFTLYSHFLTQEIPAKKKVRIRTFAVRIRTCFRVRISKNSRANQTRASDVPADWTVPGHPNVYVEIGFATRNKVFLVAFNLQALVKIQLFSVF